MTRNSYRCACEPNKNHAEGSRSAGWHQFSHCRNERVLHSYTYHACLTSKFRSIVDQMAFLYLMQAHAHCIDPIDAVTCSTFDNNRTSLRKAPKSRIPICLTVCLSLHQRPVRVVQLRKNQAKSKTLEPSSTSLKYDPRARHVSPALING